MQVTKRGVGSRPGCSPRKHREPAASPSLASTNDNQSAVHEARHRDVILRRLETRDGFTLAPLAAHMQPMGVEAPAPIAVRVIVGVEILECAHTMSAPNEGTAG